MLSWPTPPPRDPEPVLRPGRADDVEALLAMHQRCSAETVGRRYHAPVEHLTPRTARDLLEPPGGRSVLLVVGESVVAAGTFVPDPTADEPGRVELGLMVEDAWQRQGYGTRLLRALADQAARRGVETLTCLVQPDDPAVLRTIRRAGLRARASHADGVTQYRIPLTAPGSEQAVGRRRSNRPVMAEVTSRLVPLLHQRCELREVYPPADLLDQAVRGGA
jgi:GNAT superfamily N-acetyltransferase